jgi:3',5'-cyclic AMP phosphodiesterase CpdA
LAHVSDIHVFCPRARWRWRDWFTRRLAGWANHKFLPRAREFSQVNQVLPALAADVQERRPDLLIFSGDATSLGFDEEFAEAARLLRVGDPAAVPGLAVPGNHDYYTTHAVRQGLFERHFGPWLEGERVDGAIYPFARKLGDVWLIAVNSAKPNRWFWDATGAVGVEQCARLQVLLGKPEIASAPRILVTHYPICRALGQPETRHHGLLDLARLLPIAETGGVSLWLHGHRHRPYEVYRSELSAIPSICAGSGTQCDVWSYAEYLLDGPRLQITRRVFEPGTGAFREGQITEWNVGQ